MFDNLGSQDDKNNEADETYVCKDWSMAIWLWMHDLKLVGRPVRNGSDFTATFEDPDGRVDQLILEFANSDAMRFDLAAKGFKKLMSRSL